MTANNEVAGAVELELVARGWSRAQLARELGVSASWVTRRLDGSRRWSVDDLDVLGSVLGLRLALVHEEDAGLEGESLRPASVVLRAV